MFQDNFKSEMNNFQRIIRGDLLHFFLGNLLDLNTYNN